ncbi:MAG: response regulator [Candidatus Omnitrophota bacterium]|jgi:DNA-binding response OmpR family regulator|nr:response regulator [Candidatus Omnitrophota bacterium]
MDKKKILIVDDERDIRKMLRLRLEALNYEVEEASNGSEGLDKARSIEPDLIILDLMLPKIDGFKVCRMLKFDNKHKHIPVIMFTASADAKNAEIGKEVCADAYILKPFEMQELLNKIEKLLGT